MKKVKILFGRVKVAVHFWQSGHLITIVPRKQMPKCLLCLILP